MTRNPIAAEADSGAVAWTNTTSSAKMSLDMQAAPVGASTPPRPRPTTAAKPTDWT